MFKLTHTKQEINAFLKSVEHLGITESDEYEYVMNVDNIQQFNALKESKMGSFEILYKNDGDWEDTNKTVEKPDDFYKYIIDILQEYHKCFYYDAEDCAEIAAENQTAYNDALDDGFVGDFNAWCKKKGNDPEYATVPGVWRNDELIFAEKEFDSYFNCNLDGDSRDCQYWLVYSFNVE